MHIKLRRKEEEWALAAWSMKRLNCKEEEHQQVFGKVNLNMPANMKSKQKGQCLLEMDKGHTLLLSGILIKGKKQSKKFTAISI